MNELEKNNYIIPKRVKIKHLKSVHSGTDGSAITISYDNITCNVKLYYELTYKENGQDLSLFYNEDGFKELLKGDETNE